MSQCPSAYIAVDCVIPEGTDDELAERLGGLDILGTQVGDPGAAGLPVTVYLKASNTTLAATLRDIVGDLGGAVGETRAVPQADWLDHYRRQVRPFEVGLRWWLDPHPEHPTFAPAGRLRLAIEPRTAFGSGSHESTQLVLHELEERPPDGLSVLDVGTGSGILALASERLGASRVVGFDIDLGAVFVARQIANQQEWRPVLRLLAGPIESIGPGRFDLVLCNMVWEQSRPLLGELDRLLADDGAILLSGLLASERAAIVARLAHQGLVVRCERTRAEWLCLRVGRG